VQTHIKYTGLALVVANANKSNTLQSQLEVISGNFIVFKIFRSGLDDVLIDDEFHAAL